MAAIQVVDENRKKIFPTPYFSTNEIGHETNEEKENYALRSGVEALSKICIDLDISIPVGKDSLSMKTKWIDEDKEKTVKQVSRKSK